MTFKYYKCASATSHLHKISNLTKIIVSTAQFTFDYNVLIRYIIQKVVKQGIIWFPNMQIRYSKDLSEPCLNAPEIATLLMLAPARDIAPTGILTGRLTNVLSVATLDIPEGTLRPLE